MSRGVLTNLSRKVSIRSAKSVSMSVPLLMQTRSKDFRPSFSCLAEVQSLIPASTPCMACTAYSHHG